MAPVSACCACHRCHRKLLQCSCGGGHARRSARLRCDTDGVDRISALHDDLLIQILVRLGCVHAAARTGLLSRRWRGLWTRIPELVLREIKPESLDAVLAHVVPVFDPQARPQPQPRALTSGHIPDPDPDPDPDPATPLSLLVFRAPSHRSFSLDHISSLFNAAATLQPASLILDTTATQLWPRPLMLPYLDRTKSITLDMRGVRLFLLPSRDLPKLESLSFGRYHVILGGLLHLCSALHSLSISDLCPDTIMISLPLLEELFLLAKVPLQNVDIMAPRLKKLTFHATRGVVDDFTLSYLAPEVEDLSWQCTNYASRVRLGGIWTLRMVTINTSEPLRQLQHSPRSNTLSLSIWE